jgi:hypothetical protein
LVCVDDLVRKMMILAYFGPDTTLPVASAVAAVFGVVLVSGRMLLAFLRRKLRWPGRA